MIDLTLWVDTTGVIESFIFDNEWDFIENVVYAENDQFDFTDLIEVSFSEDWAKLVLLEEEGASIGIRIPIYAVMVWFQKEYNKTCG